MAPENTALLADFAVLTPVRVQWGEMDAYQHVNNAVYFRWFETARIAYTTRLGMTDLMRDRRIGPILAAISCDFRRQVVYPDEVLIGTRVARIGRTSLAMEQRIVSETARAVVAEGRSTLVVFDYAAQAPHPVPPEVRRAIADLEGRPV